MCTTLECLFLVCTNWKEILIIFFSFSVRMNALISVTWRATDTKWHEDLYIPKTTNVKLKNKAYLLHKSIILLKILLIMKVIRLHLSDLLSTQQLKEGVKDLTKHTHLFLRCSINKFTQFLFV